MSRGITPLRVAVIRTESAAADEHNFTGQVNVRRHRPVGVRLDNDGISHYWVEAGIRYTLDHDGQGWHTTLDVGANTHYRRMAAVGTPLGSTFVKTLPTADGAHYALDPVNKYMLELVDGELVLSQI